MGAGGFGDEVWVVFIFMRLIVNDETNSCYFEMECKLFSLFLDTGVKKLGGKGG